MASLWLRGLCKLFVVCSLFVFCDGATVQFFTEENFGGKMYQMTSSAACQSIPSEITPYWSMKTMKCIAVFYNNGCTPYNIEPFDFILKKEAGDLGYLRKSYRDCNNLERVPQINLDYFSGSQRTGQLVWFRNICTCTNLPSFNQTIQSINSYGNSFMFYSELNCGGESEAKAGYTYATVSNKRSFLPLDVPRYCALKYQAKIVGIETTSHVSSRKGTMNVVTITPKDTIVNNSTKRLEHNYEALKIISDAADIQLSKALMQISSFEVQSDARFHLETNSTLPIIKHLENLIQNSFESTLHSQNFTDVAELIRITAENKREVKVQKQMIVPSCTTYEVSSFVEIVESNDIEYRMLLSVTGQRGSNKVGVEEIRQNLKNITYLNNTDEHTVIAETTAILKLSYGGNTEVNVIAITMPDCRSQFLTLRATVFKIESMTNVSNLEAFINQIPVTVKEIFINNGTAPQEDFFESTKQIVEMGKFEFPEEFNRVNYILIEENFESSIPFLTSAWGDLQSGLPEINQNRRNLNEPVKFIAQSNKTFHFQKKINVPPCTKYEVNSFVEVAKDVEMEFRVQLRVTGIFGDEVVAVDEIRNILKGLTFLSNENNQTALAETTIKLMATFGVSSGVNAEGKHMVECLEAHAAFVANCKFFCSG